VTLEAIATGRVFASVSAPQELVEVYVPSDRLLGLRGDERPEAQLMRVLAVDASPRLAAVIGPSGAGKTSMILRVLADLAKRDPGAGGRHEVLLFNVGDDPGRLESPAAFMRTLVQMVERQGHRFANVEAGVLAAAAADERTRTGPQVEHRATLDAKVVSYSLGLKEAYETAKFGDNPARAREDFEDVLRLVSDEYRPVVVIDDTEHFVRPGPDGVEAESVANLFDHAIRSLAEARSVDVVVAMHPRYEEVDVVGDVVRRFAFRRIDVPSLAADAERSGLSVILARRLAHHGIDGALDDFVAPETVAQLESAYFLKDHNLRQVLDLAADASAAALTEGAARVEPRHLQPLLDASS
jgi:hypothetical protein